jgi:hypothetical protein
MPRAPAPLDAGAPPQAGQAERTGALMLLVIWGASVVLRGWNGWGDDLSALYFAARFAAEGDWAAVYAGPPYVIGYGVTPQWAAEAAALGHPGAHLNRYVYPPLWAVLFAPVAQTVGPLAFFNGALLAFAAALVAAAQAVLRLVPPQRMHPVSARLSPSSSWNGRSPSPTRSTCASRRSCWWRW